jgi:hypothetical protein
MRCEFVYAHAHNNAHLSLTPNHRAIIIRRIPPSNWIGRLCAAAVSIVRSRNLCAQHNQTKPHNIISSCAQWGTRWTMWSWLLVAIDNYVTKGKPSVHFLDGTSNSQLVYSGIIIHLTLSSHGMWICTKFLYIDCSWKKYQDRGR